MDKDPTRLLESTELSRSGRALLEAGRARPPVVFDIEAGAARFRAKIAGGTATFGLATRLRRLSRATRLGLMLLPVLPLTAAVVQLFGTHAPQTALPTREAFP